uniref:Uncharacterized protein n=1 Tax=Glossina brevipalpis TaxID=37001 RepID=A0A1A9WQ67_9MUSC
MSARTVTKQYIIITTIVNLIVTIIVTFSLSFNSQRVIGEVMILHLYSSVDIVYSIIYTIAHSIAYSAERCIRWIVTEDDAKTETLSDRNYIFFDTGDRPPQQIKNKPKK